MFATKIAMTQIFDEKGRLIPVTVLGLKETKVAGLRTEEKDGVSSVILAEIDKKAKTKKSLAGQFKSLQFIKKVREIKTDLSLEIGAAISIDSLNVGDFLRIEGVSKGKGFAGTVKRHSFHTGPKTHGSHNYRQPGSIGDTGPQRVIKGKKMAGHMGHKMTVLKKIEILRIEKDKNRIWIKGPIPGPNKSAIFIQND